MAKQTHKRSPALLSPNPSLNSSGCRSLPVDSTRAACTLNWAWQCSTAWSSGTAPLLAAAQTPTICAAVKHCLLAAHTCASMTVGSAPTKLPTPAALAANLTLLLRIYDSKNTSLVAAAAAATPATTCPGPVVYSRHTWKQWTAATETPWGCVQRALP